MGATEQHGPHLPIGTDTSVAVAVAQRLAAVRPDVLVAPAVAYGSSGEHAGFAGTLSIGQAALELVLVELGRSADAFAGVVFVCGHGGNARPLARAAATLTAEGRAARAWTPTASAMTGGGVHPSGVDGGTEVASGVDAHAGRTETSLVLALDPGAVRTALAAAGDPRPLATVLPLLQSGGVAAVSPNGVLGDPSGASAAEGERLLAALVGDLLAAVEGWPSPRPT